MAWPHTPDTPAGQHRKCSQDVAAAVTRQHVNHLQVNRYSIDCKYFYPLLFLVYISYVSVAVQP